MRLWQRSPGSTIAACLILIIGIAATTSVFSVLNSLLISPLPVSDAAHTVHIAALDRTGKESNLSLPDLLDIKHRTHLAAAFAFYRDTNGNLSGTQAQPVVAHVLEVDAAIFQALGLHLADGHPFSSDANQPGHPCESILSWSLWNTRFNRQNVVGQTLRLNEQPCQIDGVLPENLDIPIDADLWTPKAIDLTARTNSRGFHSLQAIAHLNPGVTAAAFNQELSTLAAELARENPSTDANLRIQAVPLRAWLAADSKSSVLILFAAVLAVLAIACVNVANLLLARSSTRLREVAVRVAVGANRASLFQQMITESILLAVISSVAGLGLTFLVVHWIKTRTNLNLPRVESISVDWRVLIFALVLATLTGIFFGAIPALRVSLKSITSCLSQAAGRVTDSKHHQYTRQFFIAIETALATILLAGSLLLLRSYSEVTSLQPGFQADHLLTAYVSLNPTRYRFTADSATLAKKVLDNLKTRPGIVSATFTTSIPLQGGTSGRGPIQIEGQPFSPENSDLPLVFNTGVSPSYRQTLNIRLLQGTDLEPTDDREDSPSTLVNSTFVRTFFPNQDPIGKRFRYSPNVNPDAPWQQITGVLADTRQTGPEAPIRPEIYRPLSRATNNIPGIVLRTSNNPALHLQDLQSAIHSVDPELPVFYPRTMEQVLERRLGTRSFNTTLLTAFAGIALLLAAAGIFAVIAYSVSQRTSEIGLRMACGASRAQILALILHQGLTPAFIGIIAGLAATWPLRQYLTKLLFQVKPADPMSYLGAVLLLALVSTLSALLPALRATRIEPWRALRYE